MVGGDEGFRTGAKTSDGHGNLRRRRSIWRRRSVRRQRRTARPRRSAWRRQGPRAAPKLSDDGKNRGWWRSSRKTMRVFTVIMGRRATRLVGGMRPVLSPTYLTGHALEPRRLERELPKDKYSP
ncbi:hypothetical protein D1007_12582 [Hordeum vulgare]|nr:hypothetical protein D1007_12582 [Hordeum vulgare]